MSKVSFSARIMSVVKSSSFVSVMSQASKKFVVAGLLICLGILKSSSSSVFYYFLLLIASNFSYGKFEIFLRSLGTLFFSYSSIFGDFICSRGSTDCE